MADQSRWAPEFDGYRVYDWRYRWGWSRRQLAQALGLTETRLKTIDTYYLNNPAIERLNLARIEYVLSMRASALAPTPNRAVRWLAGEKYLSDTFG